MSTISDLTITCADGFELAATLYQPKTVKAAIMLAPATGIRKRFYNSFSTFLADNGYAVISFENRGIGDSIQGNLNAGNPSLVAWGRLDMTAVLNELIRTFPDTTYHLVGHSAGGQLVGLMDNSDRITSIFNFASSSGSIRKMHFPFRLKAAFFMKFFITASNVIFGHTKSHWMGMGEPLPKKVAAQWRKWCSGTGYIAVDLDTNIQDHHFAEIKVPSLWLHATDDGIANRETVKDMIRVFPNIQAKIITLNPKEWGYTDIGHMKFFSSKSHALWQLALEWMEKGEISPQSLPTRSD